MTVTSGVYPYQYHVSSVSSEDGAFRIPASHAELVAPSAIHFEEAMYVAKSEWNRMVGRTSGYDSREAGGLFWFQTNIGRFSAALNAGLTGNFDPNPSGAFLDGTLPMTYLSNFGAIVRNDIPAEVQDEVYIAQLRDIVDDVFNEIAFNGPWQFFLDFDGLSGVKVDWLQIYKGYTDSAAFGGKWFLENEEFSSNFEGERMPSGIIFDRHLDEVRIQPIPFFSIGNGGNTVKYFDNDTDFDRKGWQFKQVGWDRRPLRPIYLMTDGGLPSGWPSGTQINYDLTPPGTNFVPSGRGGHMVSGIQLALSGTDGTWTALTGDYFSDLPNEGRPDSPQACRFENLAPSGKASIPSGQHRLMMSNPGDPVSFPWGVSGNNPHFGAVWPWTGQFEPQDGRLLTVTNRFWDITLENQAFWVTDHAFIYRNNNGKTIGRTPHVNSGLYWYQTGSTSHHTDMIDAWNMDSPRNLGMSFLYGNAKNLGKRTNDGGNGFFTNVFGGGWAYDRSVNDVMVVGRSGLGGNQPTRASGIYGRWNQQMVFVEGDVFGPKTISSTRWHISNAYNNAFDGTDWIINGALTSGLGTAPVANLCWARVDTSYNLVDAIIGPNIGWVSYLRSRSEYLALDRATISEPDELPGESSGRYKVVTPTWGTLIIGGAPPVPNSGSVSTVEHTPTFASNMGDIVNIATDTAQDRIHICKFFETEPDNKVHCTFIAFAAGANSGTTRAPDLWVGELDSSSHPFEFTNAWMIQSLGTSIGNVRLGAGFGIAHGDAGSFDHMEIHVDG